jgi:hypothetical protein
MKMTVAVVLLLSAAHVSAWAQDAGGYSAGPSEASYRTIVQSYKASPPPTQDRLFAGTRFWRLDPGRYEVETWWEAQVAKDQSGTSHLLQAEIEIGLTSHIQIDLYEVMQVKPDQSLTHEGNRIELRYSLARQYGDIWANPTVYLEWHPRHGAPDRAEARLLLGGQITGRILGAANLYYEQNVESSGPEGTDAELGAQLAANTPLASWLRFGAELKLGLDQHGTSTFSPVTLAGPNAILKLGMFKLTTTLFFGLAHDDPRIDLFLIAGYGF